MKQDRLNGLALLLIENAVASELDYSSVIEKFASLKARRVRIWVFELGVTVKLFVLSEWLHEDLNVLRYRNVYTQG